MYINKEEKVLDVPLKRRTIKANFAVHQHTKCRNCTECSKVNLEVKSSLQDPSEFLTSNIPLIRAFKDPFFEEKLSQFGSINCKKAKGILADNILGCAISHLTTSTLDFDNSKTLSVPHYFQSQNVKLDVEEKYIVFKTSAVITIPPAEIMQIDVILDTHIDMP